jgi:hypothetical protein
MMEDFKNMPKNQEHRCNLSIDHMEEAMGL